MRYVIALNVAGIIIVALSFSANRTWHSFHDPMQEEVKKLKLSGQIQEDANIDSLGTALPADKLTRLKLAELWFNFRLILIPLLLTGSVMIAWIFGRRVPPPQTYSTSPICHAE